MGKDSRAAGRALRDLPLGERAWIESIGRRGRAVRPRGRGVLEPGDTVVVSGDRPGRARRLLERPRGRI